MSQSNEAVQEPVEEERRDSSNENLLRRSIFNVPVTVTVSLGQQRMSVSDLLELRADSIVPLTAGIEDPVDLMVDKEIIARGELIEAEDGGLAIKITEIREQTDD